MIVDRRRVERLCLEVRRVEDAASAATTIREALRIATMPGDGRPGRLFIRRLDLRRIRLAAGPGPIARYLESYVRSLRGRALAIADPRAATADVVIAGDPIEPLVVALARVATGQRLDAWFWPQVDARLTAARTPVEVAAIVWSLLAARRDARGTVPAVLEAVLDGDNAVELLAAIDPILGQRLTRAMEGVPLSIAAAPIVVETLIPRRWQPAVREMIAAWSGDPRATWLIAAAVQAANPRSSAAGLARLVGAALQRLGPDGVETRASEGGRVEPTPDARRADATDAADAPAETAAAVRSRSPEQLDAGTRSERPPTRPEPEPGPVQPRSTERESSSTAPRAEPSRGPDRVDEPRARPEREGRDPTRWWLSERPRPTAHGGLYFVLRPLARLGLASFVAEHEELDELELGVRVLARLADVHGIDPDDPVRVALDCSPLKPGVRVPPPPAFEGLWTQAAPAPSLAGLDELDALVETWRAAIVAWLDRHAELTLALVIEREAAVACSRTHLDLIFDIEASDVRIRKAALDTDPGWVAWLGRVVSFHYVHGGMVDG